MIAKIWVISSIFLILVLLPINIFPFNEGFYKLEGNEKIEFSKVLNYLENGAEVESDFFNSKEREHLRDVRMIFLIIDALLIISILSLFISSYILKKKEFLDGLMKGGYISLGFVVILGLISFLDFNFIFIKFHEIVFTNNLWMLDPNKDNLIRLLPQEIFFDILKRSLLLSFVGSLSLLFISFSQKSFRFHFRD